MKKVKADIILTNEREKKEIDVKNENKYLGILQPDGEKKQKTIQNRFKIE